MREIIHDFPITEKEFLELDKKFSKLCWCAAHELKRKPCSQFLCSSSCCHDMFRKTYKSLFCVERQGRYFL